MKPPWPGFLRDFHDVLVRGQDPPITDAPASFVHAAALAALAVAVASKVTFPYATRLITPTFHAAIVGNTHEHRRSTAMGLARRIVSDYSARVRRPLLVDTDFSAEGLVEYMARDPANQNLLLTFDIEAFYGGAWWGDKARRLIIRLLDEADPSQSLRTGKEPLIIQRPRVCILAALNPAALPQIPKAGAEFHTGFLGRLLTILPANEDGSRVGLDYRPPRIHLPSLIREGDATMVGAMLHERAEVATAFEKFSQQGQKLFLEWAAAHQGRVDFDQADSRFQTLSKHLPDHLVRIAALYQVDLDPDSREVGLRPVEEAIRFIEVAHQAVAHLGGADRAVALSEYDRLAT